MVLLVDATDKEQPMPHKGSYGLRKGSKKKRIVKKKKKKGTK